MIRALLAATLAVGLSIPSPAAAEPARVGFVNLTPDPAGQAAISSLRAGLRQSGNRRFRATDPRPALERPRLPAAGDAPPTLDLDAARAAYRAFETDEALEALDAAEAERRHHSPSPELYRQFADIALLRGQVLAGAERAEDAREAFMASRVLAPRRDLDPAKYPPAIRELYDRSAPGRATEHLAVEAPVGATIWVDGKKIGDAPVKDIAVSNGLHLITAVLAGHRTETMWGEGDVAIAMAPLPGRERAADLRDTLSISSLDLGVLAEIAAIAEVDALVIVARRDGSLSAALYDKRQNHLGAWTEPGPAVFGSGSGAERAVDTRTDSGGGGGPWYKTWWGVSIIGGAAVVTTIAVIGLASRDSDVTIGGIEWR